VSSSFTFVCRRLAQGLAVCAMLMVQLACESTSTPTAPTGTLQVTATTTVLRAGETLTLTVTPVGTTTPAITWTSSDGSVASVDPTGLVTARRAGNATIRATTTSASGQVTLRVVSNFSGTWTGPLVRVQTTCASTSTSPVCASTTTPTALLAPVTLVLVQAGATVTGTLTDGLEPQSVVPLQGSVDSSDALTLDGRSTPQPTPTSVRRLTISGLRATIDPTVDTLTGAYVMLAERGTSTGAFEIDYAIQAQFRDLPRR
jgi:hypothetical protein